MSPKDPKATILVVDDEKYQREALQVILEDEGYKVATAADGREALTRASELRPEIVLSDLKMPGLSGLDVIRALHEGPLPPRIILITAHGSVERAREAHKLGAFDYMSKPVVADELLFRVERALETFKLTEKNLRLERRLKNDALEAIVGESPALREVFRLVEKVAPTSSTILIRGESGTGKELVARAVHSRSPRSGKPFFAINCAAIPENLLESELFGHEKGSFTGAIMARQGLFEVAQGGTIFLDELGELSLDLQPKLLRALEQREIRRVGSNKPIKIDVRVIAATNRNLAEEVKAGRFREDLFYRLSVVRLILPPLRERKEDLPHLTKHILARGLFNRDADGNQRTQGVSREALDALMNYEWPGNVRELVNVVERACAYSEGEYISLEDLPENISGIGVVRRRPNPEAATARERIEKMADKPFKEAKEEWLSSFERDYIFNLLKRNSFNISHAAREADIDRKYFRKLMKKYGVDGVGGEE